MFVVLCGLQLKCFKLRTCHARIDNFQLLVKCDNVSVILLAFAMTHSGDTFAEVTMG